MELKRQKMVESFQKISPRNNLSYTNFEDTKTTIERKHEKQIYPQAWRFAQTFKCHYSMERKRVFNKIASLNLKIL